MLADLQLETVVKNLLDAADRCTKALEADKDWKASWAVHYDLVKALQGLGVFGAQEKPIDPSALRDQQQAEVNAMVELELKRRQRESELLQMHRDDG